MSLSYLSAFGQRASTILPLTWFVLFVAASVCLVIGALLYIAIAKKKSKATHTAGEPVVRSGNGLRLIGIGLAISLLPLLATVVWTVAALAQLHPPPARRQSLGIAITANQWWWSIKYQSDRPSEIFATANEIHIPVGVPVLLTLRSRDVIHSFWVPKLAGKTDVIPGQTNRAWIQADVPGVYRGQCQEYCGLQHAHMGFEVVAEPMADFLEWRRRQLQTAPPPITLAEARGRELVEYRCSLCHSVRGTIAGSNVGPDLTHVASRRKIAAATLQNHRGNLAGWIENPQAIKSGAHMPNQHLSGRELTDVVVYLETLQ